VKIILLGLGSIGRKHAESLKRIAPSINVEPVRGLGRHRDNVTGPGLGVTEELALSLRADIDAAIIASPASVHIAQARVLLDAGIPVLIEKPLGIDLNQAIEFCEFAEARNATCLIGYLLRYSSAARTFKEHIDKLSGGRLLHVHAECGSYLPDWPPAQDYRKGVSARQARRYRVLSQKCFLFQV
jgi:predicted dehydrogenase